MTYEFKVLAFGTSSFNLLKGDANNLQEVLNDPPVQELQEQGYELWQVNRLSGGIGSSGLILIFRRPR
jgi:hypothetical protein